MIFSPNNCIFSFVIIPLPFSYSSCINKDRIAGAILFVWSESILSKIRLAVSSETELVHGKQMTSRPCSQLSDFKQ